MNIALRLLLPLPVILPSAFSSAQAQHPMVLAKLAEWNQAAPAPNDQLVIASVRAASEGLYGQTASCAATDVAISKMESATADRYTVNGLIAGTLKNAWFVTVQMPKCDTAPVRFMILQQLDDRLKSIRVNRGTSYAWESLISDTLPLAQLGAAAALRRKGLKCDSDERAQLGIIRISSEGADLGPVQYGIRYKGSWSEIWPLQLCNHSVEVTVEFTADGDGGAYNGVPGDKVRVLP